MRLMMGFQLCSYSAVLMVYMGQANQCNRQIRHYLFVLLRPMMEEEKRTKGEYNFLESELCWRTLAAEKNKEVTRSAVNHILHQTFTGFREAYRSTSAILARNYPSHGSGD